MDSIELRGHRAAVTSLDCALESPLLASGSEDRTVRIWDTNSARSVKCFHGCFEHEVEAVHFSKTNNSIIFAVTECSVYSFDLRKDVVLDSVPLAKSSCIFTDISSVAFGPKDNIVAIADETDCINILSIDSSGQFNDSALKKLRKVHENSIGGLAFAEKKKEVVSGGFDFLLCKWDLDTFKPSKRTEVKSFESLESSNQTLNPPFVTGLQYVPGAPAIAAAIGDGSLRLLASSDFGVLTQVGAHSAMITGLHAYAPNAIITGGLDGQVRSWRIVNLDSKKRTGPVSLESAWTINHKAKINAVRSPGADNKVFVCDTSPHISLHHIL